MMITNTLLFNKPTATETYTLSLHDALPICERHRDRLPAPLLRQDVGDAPLAARHPLHRPPQLLLGVHQQRRLLQRSEEHTSELQSQSNLVCRLLLEKKKVVYQWCTYVFQQP